jgi:hypothetical protein
MSASITSSRRSAAAVSVSASPCPPRGGRRPLTARIGLRRATRLRDAREALGLPNVSA